MKFAWRDIIQAFCTGGMVTLFWVLMNRGDVTGSFMVFALIAINFILFAVSYARKASQ